MSIEGDMGRISCIRSMSRDILGFTCGICSSWPQGNLNSKGLRSRGSMTYLRVSLSMFKSDPLVP